MCTPLQIEQSDILHVLVQAMPSIALLLVLTNIIALMIFFYAIRPFMKFASSSTTPN
jgi:hypothetical protein